MFLPCFGQLVGKFGRLGISPLLRISCTGLNRNGTNVPFNPHLPFCFIYLISLIFG